MIEALEEYMTDLLETLEYMDLGWIWIAPVMEGVHLTVTPYTKSIL